MKKPWELAAKWYERYVPHKDFGDEMADAIRSGVLYSDSDTFIMACETRWDGQGVVEGEPNAWFVTMAAMHGDNAIRRVMDAAPHPHDWCLWRRRNDGQIRAHRWQDLKRKLKGGQ